MKAARCNVSGLIERPTMQQQTSSWLLQPPRAHCFSVYQIPIVQFGNVQLTRWCNRFSRIAFWEGGEARICDFSEPKQSSVIGAPGDYFRCLTYCFVWKPERFKYYSYRKSMQNILHFLIPCKIWERGWWMF